MPVKIRITDNDIALAENILFSRGEKFDDERIDFIKNLETIDLQAVPGSGKTTALMAKLLILEKYLPFDDGSGILVISHTNAAVDEIKNTIGKYCPKLFSVPNFVGTIQGFVDQFLAIPFYLGCYKSKHIRIDDDVYNEKVEEYYASLHQKSRLRFWIDKKPRPLQYLQNLRFDVNMNLTNRFGGKMELNCKNGSPTYKAIRAKKLEWLKSGFLCYDDAYFLADLYLKKYPRIKTLLQKRFSYVFVDEMQDMEKHQHDLLERIFFDGANSTSKYQRIGDKNQAIYSREITLDEIWSERKTLTINGSHRLTPPLAELVNCFALHKDAGFQVRGMREGDIPPHLIVYEDATIGNVIQKYSEIINGLLAEGKIPLSGNKYKVIAWVKSHQEGNKTGLSDYFPDFDFINHSPRIDYSFFGEYLNADAKANNSLAPIQNNIINVFLKVLRLENIRTGEDRIYTKNSLFAYLKDSHEVAFNKFRLMLFQWSMSIAQGKDVRNLIRAYIPDFLSFWGKAIDLSKEFIFAEVQNNNKVAVEEPHKKNIANYHGFDINVTTVHAEKGKTHTATLYLETFYSRGQGNYESERLKDQFLYLNLNLEALKVVKQSAKMMYVGLSRPTHLLCVAVHKARFDKYLSEIDTGKWVIENL